MLDGADYTQLTAAELERLGGDRLGEYAFYRFELRRSSCRRELGCGCVIPPRDLYRYAVAKVVGVAQLQQTTECDFHMRSSNRY